MRLLLLLLLATPFFSSAQQINGLLKDENGQPIPNATISLLRGNDSVLVKLTITKINGSYSFIGIKEGNYLLKASYVGYKNSFSQKFSYSQKDISIDDLSLRKQEGSLANVTVTANKPLVEVRADRTILNVEGTINSVGSNALELIRKSPGVLLDKDDNISLAGKNGVQIYIDGRPNPLSGADLANFLKTLQSSEIESVEIITNPSAKYDAAGNAGIINIRLKKNKSLGANGSINAGWNIGTYAKYNAGASLNYRNKKINLFSTYNFNKGLTEQHISTYRTVLDSLFDQKGMFLDRRKSHSIKAGLDYFINRKSTLGFIVNGTISDPHSESNNQTYISSLSSHTADRLLKADNNTHLKRNNANINLNYSYIDPKGTSLSLNGDHGYYDLNSDQRQGNYYFDPSGTVYRGNVIYHMLSPSQININSFKADYETNAAKGKLGIGAKTALIKTDNDFQRYDVFTSGEALDRDRSNHFIYKENINALYVNYNRKFKTFMLQAGLRAENTVSDGSSNGMKFDGSNYVPSVSAFHRSYTDLFPSAAFTFNKNPKKVWGLSFSRRIDRPAYQDLNPFEFKLDEYTFMKGNINLRPQYTNNAGISYTYKMKLNLGLNYSHVKDMFTQIIDTVEKSRAFVSRKNLATQDIVAFTLSYPFQYKTYSVFTSIGGNYSKYQADFGTGRKVDLDAVGFNVFMQHSLKFKKTWTAELSGFYNAPTIYMGSFKGRSIYSLDAGLSKQVMKGKATVKAALSDVFNTMRFRATSNFAGQQMTLNFKGETRQFKLSLNYRFGNNGVKPARQRTTGSEEENKRTQQSGGMGIGN